MVDVPTLQPSAVYDPAIMEKWCGKQRGLVFELLESGDYDHPDIPMVCPGAPGAAANRPASVRISKAVFGCRVDCGLPHK